MSVYKSWQNYFNTIEHQGSDLEKAPFKVNDKPSCGQLFTQFLPPSLIGMFYLIAVVGNWIKEFTVKYRRPFLKK